MRRTSTTVASALVVVVALSSCSSAGDESLDAPAAASAAPSVTSPSAPTPVTDPATPSASPTPSAAPSTAPSSAAAATPAPPSSVSPAAAPEETASTTAPAEPADPEAPADTCSLLTAGEVSAELGVQILVGHYTEAGPPFAQKICSWANEELPNRVYTLSLQRTADMSPKLVKAGGGARKLFRQAVALQRKSGGPLERVNGIGSEAYLIKSAVIAIKGETFINATLLRSDGTIDDEASINLTRLAVSRI